MISPEEEGRPEPRIRYDEVPDGFQRDWLGARQLSEEQVDLALRHGLDAYDRFADRPFREVEDHLRESWEARGAASAWEDVADIVRTGYERYRAAGLNQATDPGPEAKDRAPRPPSER